MVRVVIDDAYDAIVDVSLNEEAADEAGDAISLPKFRIERDLEGGVIGRGDSLVGGDGRTVVVVVVVVMSFSESTIWVGESGVIVREVIRFGVDLEEPNLWPSPVKPIFLLECIGLFSRGLL